MLGGGKRIYRVYRLMVETTSLPLAVLLYLMFISGYGLVKTYAVRAVTLGLLDYALCIRIHTSPEIRITLLALAILHGFSGFQLLALRIRNKYLRVFFKTILWATTIIVIVQIILIELW